MSAPISDHAYRPDRQSQWHTGRCDLCGEAKAAHLPAAYEQGWMDGYGQGRDDEAGGLPVRDRTDVVNEDAPRWVRSCRACGAAAKEGNPKHYAMCAFDDGSAVR